MRCIVCKGILEDKTTTFTLALDDRIVVIKDVPSHVCSQCGETSYDDIVFRQLERIVEHLRDVITEVAITSYSVKIA